MDGRGAGVADAGGRRGDIGSDAGFGASELGESVVLINVLGRGMDGMVRTLRHAGQRPFLSAISSGARLMAPQLGQRNSSLSAGGGVVGASVGSVFSGGGAAFSAVGE